MGVKTRPGRVTGWCAAGRARQNPPKESSATRYVHVIHPHHPLVGQLVRVVRQAEHPAYSERQWVIELVDQTCASIPLSWAVPVQDTQEPGLITSETWPDGLWADAASLLKLTKMVQYLTTNQLEEVLPHEPSRESSHSTGKPHSQAEDGRSFSGMGTVTSRVPARASDNTSNDIDQTAAKAPRSSAGGGL